MANKTKSQEYTALVTLASLDGGERWTPGSKIVLDDDRAAVHLAAGNVAPLDHTDPPVVDVGPAVVVHMADEPEKVTK